MGAELCCLQGRENVNMIPNPTAQGLASSLSTSSLSPSSPCFYSLCSQGLGLYQGLSFLGENETLLVNHWDGTENDSLILSSDIGKALLQELVSSTVVIIDSERPIWP